MQLRNKITCHHCWHRFARGDMVWVAQHPELRGDAILGDDAFLRFLPTRFTIAGDALDPAGAVCQELACPNCHLPIPREFLRHLLLVFSLIGITASGKSYYLTAATWELGRLLPQFFSLAFRDLDAEGNATLAGYQKSLFLQDEVGGRVAALERTQPDSRTHYDWTMLDGQRVLLPRPFLYCLNTREDHPSPRRGRVLCLYDNAGELYQPGRDSMVMPGTRHMAKAQILMFLFDPTQDPRIRKACRQVSNDPQLDAENKTELQGPILTEAVNRIRKEAHIETGRKLDKPLLVLVSKSDIWGPLLDDEDLVSEPYVEADGDVDVPRTVDVERVERVSQKLRALLLELTPEFVATCEDCCAKVVYVPVSSLGCSPRRQDDGGLLVVETKDVHPRWVTVPFIYSFAVWSSGLFFSSEKREARSEKAQE